VDLLTVCPSVMAESAHGGELLHPLPAPSADASAQPRGGIIKEFVGLRRRASKEHQRLQAAQPSERLRAVLERALTAGREPGPRVLLREELRRAEEEVAALTEAIKAANEVLRDRSEHKPVSPDEQSSRTTCPSLSCEEATVPAAPHQSSEPSSSSASGEIPARGQLDRSEPRATRDTHELPRKAGKSLLDRQVDSWLQQERVKNLVQPYSQTPSSMEGGESLLYRESLARLELDDAKSTASSDDAISNAIPGSSAADSGTSDSLLYQVAKASAAKARPSAIADEQKSDALRCESLQRHDTDESLLLRESLSRQARSRSLSNLQRLSLDAERANGMQELRDARSELAVAIDAAKRHGVMEVELAQAEALRRRVHNNIEDLKGSIRVFCCVRPMNDREMAMGDKQAVTSIDNMTVKVQNLWEKSVFDFDAVFSPARQEEVFRECNDLMQSALDGHNVTVFAYGQTSAGKTHTLFGQPGQPGLAPRMIQEIYRIVDKESDRFAHTISASMLELYKNDLVDLLSKDSPRAAIAKKEKLAIRTDKNGSVQIENLLEEVCQNAAELHELLERGHRQRTTRATAMNSQSSRSHIIFTVRVTQVNLETGEQLRGKIMVCDLAGSERLKKSMVTGEAAKEAIEINKSLTALGDVVSALRQGQKQIPYRNHKLTQLMQDSLGQASKMLMFVNCSPASSNVEETLNSLKYAARAKKIKNVSVAADKVLMRRRASEPQLMADTVRL